jgi:sphinganine-1-phosphate aldolase
VLTKLFLSAVKLAPGGKGLIAKETQKTIDEIKAFTMTDMGEFDEIGVIAKLPAQGMTEDKLIPMMRKLRGAETDYRGGKAFGGIYYDSKDLKTAVSAAYAEFADSNGLFPGIFPALKKFEMETVRMTIDLLHGDANVQGVMTTGGSESIMLCIKAYKEQAYANGITDPEAVIPISAHPAFAKGCNYFGVKFVGAECLSNGLVDMKDVRKKINSNTAFLVGSAPGFPHGVIDPIAELAQIAKSKNLGLHVDACLGGFLLPFLEKNGRLRKDAQYDFRVDGVTSMSADLHKYGFGPKGSSVCLFSSAALREQMFFSWTEWSGGQYASPSMTGSRNGGILASAWATLMLMGEEGYLKIAEDVYAAFSGVVEGIKKIPGLELIGEPDAACVGFKCTDGDETKIYKVAAALKQHFGWGVNYLQKPVAIGVQIGSRNGFDPELFCGDLKKALALVNENPNDYSGGLTQIYGMAANLGDRTAVDDLLKAYLSAQYSCQ